MTNPLAFLLKDVPRQPSGNSDHNKVYLLETDVLAALAATVPADLAEAGKVLEGVTPGPWSYRPDQYDDWGVVKANGFVLCQVRDPARYTTDHLADAREANFDPWEANARFIAWCRNHVPALLARLAAQEAVIKGLEAEVAEVTSDRAYIIGANAGWEAAVEQGEATPAAAAMLARTEAAETRPSWDEYNTVLSAGYDQKARAEAAETALAAERAKTAKLVALVEEARLMVNTKTLAGKLWDDNARAAITEAGQ